jgi:toxin ParE1/3/4
MPRLELRYRPAALADLEDIFRAVRRVSGSPAVARRTLPRTHPRTVPPHHTGAHGGRPRDDLGPGLRSVPFERRAVIIYRVLGEAVEIVNIFHGRRDYAALYRRHEADHE